MIDPKDAEFTDFVAAHGAQLLRTACLVTGDSHLGEDLVQTALAKAYGSWAKVQQADHPVAYVRRLMINTHLSWVRRLTNTERPLETLPGRRDGRSPGRPRRDRRDAPGAAAAVAAGPHGRRPPVLRGPQRGRDRAAHGLLAQHRQQPRHPRSEPRSAPSCPRRATTSRRSRGAPDERPRHLRPHRPPAPSWPTTWPPPWTPAGRSPTPGRDTAGSAARPDHPGRRRDRHRRGGRRHGGRRSTSCRWISPATSPRPRRRRRPSRPRPRRRRRAPSPAPVEPATWETRTFHGRHVRRPAGRADGRHRGRRAGVLVDRRPPVHLERPAPERGRVLLRDRHGHRDVRGRAAPPRDGGGWYTVPGADKAYGDIGEPGSTLEEPDAVDLTYATMAILVGDRVFHVNAWFPAGADGEQMAQRLLASLAVTPAPAADPGAYLRPGSACPDLYPRDAGGIPAEHRSTRASDTPLAGADGPRPDRLDHGQVIRSGKEKDPPRTRQSPLILAAFRPWGGSQDDATRGVWTPL